MVTANTLPNFTTVHLSIHFFSVCTWVISQIKTPFRPSNYFFRSKPVIIILHYALYIYRTSKVKKSDIYIYDDLKTPDNVGTETLKTRKISVKQSMPLHQSEKQLLSLA